MPHRHPVIVGIHYEVEGQYNYERESERGGEKNSLWRKVVTRYIRSRHTELIVIWLYLLELLLLPEHCPALSLHLRIL